MNEALDPVCGMEIDPATAAGSSTVDGKTFYFCAKACKTRFDAEPSRYGASAPEPAACCGPSCCRA